MLKEGAIFLVALCRDAFRALLSDQTPSIEDRQKNVFFMTSDGTQDKLDPKHQKVYVGEEF